MRALIALAALVMLTGAALAQDRTFYDRAGRVIGKAKTDSNGGTTFYDAAGRVTGKASPPRRR